MNGETMMKNLMFSLTINQPRNKIIKFNNKLIILKIKITKYHNIFRMNNKYQNNFRMKK